MSFLKAKTMWRWLGPLFTPSVWDILGWSLLAAPTAVVGGAGMIGVYDAHALMWAVTATTVTLASTIMGILAYRNFQFQRDPEHKLQFIRPLVARDGNIVAIGFEVKNEAVFPIETEIIELYTSCAQRVGQSESRWLNRKMLVAPGQFRFTYGENIDMSGITGPRMKGQLRFSLSYGHPKRRRCKMNKDLDLFVPLDPMLPFSQSDRLPTQTDHVKLEHV